VCEATAAAGGITSVLGKLHATFTATLLRLVRWTQPRSEILRPHLFLLGLKIDFPAEAAFNDVRFF
jgi:hypothetical protein